MDFSGWEKLSLVDFDDYITTTLFSSGCNFRCPFCHNGPLVLHPESASKIDFERILDYLRKRKGVVEGVCISGGEPTLGDDLLDKMREIKALGYKIKLDSNGYRPEIIQKALDEGLVDYFAMDIKNSPDLYGKTCGLKDMDVSRIIQSIALIMGSGKEYEFRTTIIKEFHSVESISEAAKMIQGADKYFLQMYVDRDGCIEHGFHAVDKEEAEQMRKAASSFVKAAYLRNYD